MRATPTTIVRHAMGIAIAACLALASGLAAAAPDEAADPVLKLLLDKGVLAAAPAASAAVAAPEPAPAEPGLLRIVQDHAASMVVGAMNFIGVRYQRGGTSAETGFDCSGFTRHVFEMSLGLVLPRSADEQALAPGLVAVRREDLKPGDLVFFNTLRRTFSHVGIYVGDNRFIHSPRAGGAVRTEDMSFSYWARRFTGARRVEPSALPPTQTSAMAPGAAANNH